MTQFIQDLLSLHLLYMLMCLKEALWRVYTKIWNLAAADGDINEYIYAKTLPMICWLREYANKYTSISAATCLCACTWLHFDEVCSLIEAGEWHWWQKSLPARGPSSVLCLQLFPSISLQKKPPPFDPHTLTIKLDYPSSIISPLIYSYLFFVSPLSFCSQPIVSPKRNRGHQFSRPPPLPLFLKAVVSAVQPLSLQLHG